MQRIYLDANATTPALPEVVEAMRPYWGEQFGNPSSTHASGQRTRAAVERARSSVAGLLQARNKEIVFTSGGTEADNLALFGVLSPYLRSQRPVHLITTQMEHHAVLNAAEALQEQGAEVTFLPPSADGVIEAATFEAALRPETRLVSVMLANNETGAIQPLGKLARIAKNYASAHNQRIVVHTDAVQAAGKLPVDLAGEFKNVDLLSLSGHKLYGPQGTGALFVRTGVEIAPMFYGGPHERQRRAGTENVPGIVGLGRAADLASEWVGSSAVERMATLRDHLESSVMKRVPGTAVNAAGSPRSPNTTNLRFAGVDAEALVIALDVQGVSASFGAACQSGATEPSHVLLSMGLTPAEARSSLRLSLTRHTTAQEVDRAIEIIAASVVKLRSLARAS